MTTNESEQTKILREILKWLKFAGIKEAKAILLSSLDTEAKKLAYHLSDGTRGTVEIAKIVNIGSTRTIFDIWQVWLKQGLGESIPVKGGSRFKRSFDLEEVGIAIPQYTIKQEEKTASQK
ncbi:MAG: hypothetical protein NWF04_00075 [Candidatus Bathyarchaeota archaeon]|nr:hypothetical protein [Candidatus Bathyarchaeota archaeon]